ncbi:MAG: putative toxin-antitoxin system toxin component, PIN family, partial [Flammeovirgaceae bacterium]|nr:putative toxin-antitoxin system toxin component, PIN family [Flammeovirgaceae bacterium]
MLISGILGSGFPHYILNLVFDERARLFVSPSILDEFRRVIYYKKFEKTPGFLSKAEKVFKAVRLLSIEAQPKIAFNLLPDPDDNKFIDLAIAVEADFLITGNSKHFPFTKIENT